MTFNTQASEKIKSMGLLYLGAVSFIIVPLYMRYGYHNLISAKAKVYLYTVIPALIIIAIAGAAGITSESDKVRIQFESRKKSRGTIRPRTSFYLLSMIGIWSLLSSYFSQSFELSLMGTAGWSVGSLMTVVMVICTICVSRQFQYNYYLSLCVMAVNIFINLLAIMQSAGADPFGLLRDMNAEQRYTYLSTIGQKNSYSGYLCLVLPLFWGAFITCKNRMKEIFCGIFAAFGFMGVIAAESDSIFAGIGICMAFMLPFVFETEQYVKRASMLLIIYSCCLLIVRYLPVFADKTIGFMGLSEIMIKFPAAEIILVSGILLYLRGWKTIGGKRGRYTLIAIESTFVILICMYAVHTATHFDDSWGTWRGMVWRVGWEHFLDFPLRKKLIGIGPEMLITLFMEIRDATGRTFAAAHCEPLQVLLAQGIIGLGLYIAFWGYLLILFFKKKLWKTPAAVLFFPLAAYWGQSLFCSVYPITAIVFSFVSGMYLKFAEQV